MKQQWRKVRWVRNTLIALGAVWLMIKSIVWTGPLDPAWAAWLNGLFGAVR